MSKPTFKRTKRSFVSDYLDLQHQSQKYPKYYTP